MKLVHKFSFIACLASLLLILTACSTTHASNPKKSIQVTTSVNFYGEVAQKVLGSHGHVTSIINNPNVDPHDFNPSSSDAKKVYQANLVIYNGLGYDSWAQKLISSNDNTNTINVGRLMGKKTGDNPHIWYNIDTMEKLAYQLANKFAKFQPKNAKEFKANAQRYIATLKPLQQQLQNIKQHKKNKPVAVSEPVFDYSLAKMGYQVSDKDFETATEKDNDPAPISIKKLQNQIKNHDLAFLVVNKQVNSKIITNLTNLAKVHHLPVVAVTETQPSQAKSYVEWMQKQYQQIMNLEK
jgi:zinc/manganese transport system substrate-binding protein